MPDDRLIQNLTARWLLLLFGVPASYAIFRYHIFGGVDWAHLPLFIAVSSLVAFIAAMFPLLMRLLGAKPAPAGGAS